jgi:hypothetical protein
VAVPRRWRSFHGLGAGFFCVRSSDSAQLSSYAVLHSGVVASRVCGRGRSESPSAAVACLGCRLHSVSPDGDGSARRWGCNHRTLVSARARGETPPLAAEASKAASDRLMRPQRVSRVSGECLIGDAKPLGHFLFWPHTIGGLPSQQT